MRRQIRSWSFPGTRHIWEAPPASSATCIHGVQTCPAIPISICSVQETDLMRIGTAIRKRRLLPAWKSDGRTFQREIPVRTQVLHCCFACLCQISFCSKRCKVYLIQGFTPFYFTKKEKRGQARTINQAGQPHKGGKQL